MKPFLRCADTSSAKGSASGWRVWRPGAHCATLRVLVALCAAGTLPTSRPVLAGGPSDAVVTENDPDCDVVARRTDPGADAPFDPAAHRLIDLLEFTIGSWSPTSPASDIFTGDFTESGEFVRLDLVLDGLVNPPGSVDPLDFRPFRFGDHPVFGFVEIDMDEDNQTGGELDAPQYRYLGNIVRFGGRPSDDDFDHRVALDGSSFDGDFETEPFVERHGEEFHLALLGDELGPGSVTEVVGNGDSVFDEGETWNIRASWFHRAHGFEPFSVADGGLISGEYAPTSDVRFRHDVLSDETQISLVFPLTNVGAGLVLGEPAEPNNSDPSDQASVLEALDDLVLSAEFLDFFPTGLPEEEIIIRWKDKNPEQYLDPIDWRVTVLLGSSYTAPDPLGEFFVWNDVYPDVLGGDVTGDGNRNSDDEEAVGAYILAEDASDGMVDGSVTILSFATDFTVFDVNHDGVVNASDAALLGAPSCSVPPIPTLSQWGVVAMTLLVLVAATLVFGQARPANRRLLGRP